jgi:RimJ/RimL family protein N-acetyltransferase
MDDEGSDSSTSSIFAGRLVRLRTPEAEDWEASREADHDSQMQRLGFRIELPRSRAGARRWAEEQATAEPDGDNRRLAIERLEDGALVGGTSTHQCDPLNGTFSYGIAIFRPYWQRGYASDTIKVLLRYYFGERRYQKVNVTVYAFNEASLALHRRLGFVEEGRIRRSLFTGGQYHDEILFGMTAEEFPMHHPDFAPRMD